MHVRRYGDRAIPADIGFERDIIASEERRPEDIHAELLVRYQLQLIDRQPARGNLGKESGGREVQFRRVRGRERCT
jgi:hypothetical protein